MENSKKINWLNVLYAIVAIAFVGLIGRWLTDTNSAWYTSLIKPREFLPAAVFPIVWGLIYACFAVLIYLLLEKDQLNGWTYGLLIANGAGQLIWSLVYFRMNSLLLGIIVIVFLLTLAITLLFNLAKKNKIYLYLMIIYPIWLVIATILNTALWTLN